MNKHAEFIIGIDLGTTHTVVAFADLSKELSAENCEIFKIEQLIGPGKIAKLPLLPSFRYHPAAGELNDKDTLLPWSCYKNDLEGELPQVVIGEWARSLGAKVDGRQVVSAKSWLSHPQVDKHANILPWASVDGVDKVSPILASASYLFHVRQAWNKEYPQARMEDQEIIITIPASFDEDARGLTVEAAKQAGLGHILLLEEPQAVCYDWYSRHQHQAAEQLKHIDLLMVCDVGGGTTDLSLIDVKQNASMQLSLNRVAVGHHLMLGGDNIDLALAHVAEQALNKDKNKKLSAASLSQLIQQTRKAKEILLSHDAPSSTKVTLLGSGAKLIGGAKSVELTREVVHNIALAGFMPLTAIDDMPQKRRSAIVEFGLPYASDPAISKHLAAFIQEHQNSCKQSLTGSHTADDIAIPDALLLNGGVFNSPLMENRAHDLLRHWSDKEVCLLDNQEPDLAVAKGAVAYAKARRGAQLKIGGGSARNFFLMLEKNDQTTQIICIMPKGTEEDSERVLADQRFTLTTGKPVQFHVLSGYNDQHFRCGELLEVNNTSLLEGDFISLPPLVMALQNDNAAALIEVTLTSVLTDVGTLQLECVADDNRRWQLAFQSRQTMTNQPLSSPSELPDNFPLALEAVNNIYGASKKKTTIQQCKNLRKDLEKLIGQRENWHIETLRNLADVLSENKNRRRRSADHERMWLNLSGYCLRPGFGMAGDPLRIEQLWPVYLEGLSFSKKTQQWSAWWNFWARASGGLRAEQQQIIFNDIRRYLDVSALESRKITHEGKLKSYHDMVKLAATLEHLSAEEKTDTALSLLERLESGEDSNASWWAVGRLASRSLFYGSKHTIIDKDEIEIWLEPLTELNWKENYQAAFAVVLMCRKTGDRTLDVSEVWRNSVIEKLTTSRLPNSWVDMVENVKSLNEEETQQVFGEALPSGLRLINHSMATLENKQETEHVS